MGEIVGGICTAILCGGKGARLWPLSTETVPKQFLSFGDGPSLLAQTLARAVRISDQNTFLIADQSHQRRLEKTCLDEGLSASNLILEREGKNTAFAIGLACLAASSSGARTLLVLPSDHAIDSEQAFLKSVGSAIPLAEKRKLVVFGVEPKWAEPNYGYIEARTTDCSFASDVATFTEKPAVSIAQGFCESGDHFWNSGIFLTAVSSLIEQFERLEPDLWAAVNQTYLERTTASSGAQVLGKPTARTPGISFDKAIVENYPDVAMVRAGFGWQDVGTFQGLREHLKPVDSSNVTHGNVVASATTSSLLISNGQKLVVEGMDDVAAIVTPEAVLIRPLEKLEGGSPPLAPNIGNLAQRPFDHGETEQSNWFSDWYLHAALPQWSKVLQRDYNGAFPAAYDRDFKPVRSDAPGRLIGRVVHSLALSEKSGWITTDRSVMADAISRMQAKLEKIRRPFSETFDTGLCDLPDLSAFLLAGTSAGAAGHAGGKNLAEAAMSILTEFLSPSMDGPAFDGLPLSGESLMHLHEAVLRQFECSGDPDARLMAERIVSHFKDHLWMSEHWAAREEPDAQGHMPRRWDPGHTFEWCWRLFRHAMVFQDDDLYRICRKLDAAASSIGSNRLTGLAYLSMRDDLPDAPLISRNWSQAEAVRSAIALHHTGVADAKYLMDARLESLRRYFLADAVPGGWMDLFDYHRDVASFRMPTSSFYHFTNLTAAMAGLPGFR